MKYAGLSQEEIVQRLEELELETNELIKALETDEPEKQREWPPKTFYWGYHIVTGHILGGFGAITSLLINVLGATLLGPHPLQLIKVYLTFPWGDAGLRMDNGLTLMMGTGLYVVTGAAYGIVFEVIMAKYFARRSIKERFLVATGLGLSIWIVNFYLILSWLQPLLLGGNWIISMIPWWVAALTHLAFAWTMLIIGEWGHFEATDYKRQAMVRNSLS